MVQRIICTLLLCFICSACSPVVDSARFQSVDESFTESPIPTPSPTELPAPTPALGQSSPTILTVPLTDPFGFGPTPENSLRGGINGVFYYLVPASDTCSKLYDVIRFYDDGVVLSVDLCAPDGILESWPEVNKWFQRNDAPMEVFRGNYYYSDRQVRFSVANTGLSKDYFGIYSDDKLQLSVYEPYGSKRHQDLEYVRLPSEN
jgi:hypothetical protein